jgi:hypothetical protein
VGKERACAREIVWCVVCELWVTDAHGVHVCKLTRNVMSRTTAMSCVHPNDQLGQALVTRAYTATSVEYSMALRLNEAQVWRLLCIWVVVIDFEKKTPRSYALNSEDLSQDRAL